MVEHRSRLLRFASEMRRRNVFRAGLAYGVVVWFVVQAASIVFPALHVPDWSITLVVVLSIIGFPVALVLAWAYDLTPAGVRRAGPDAGDGGGDSSDPGGPDRTESGGAALAGPEVARDGTDGRAGFRRIPVQLNPLVGRHQELAQAVELLGSSARLLTIAGPGGIGKTRLAIAIAEAAAPDFPDGVCFVPLGDVEPGGSIAPTIAAHLELHLASREDARAQLLSFLRGKQILLVLDNFEHLVDQAPVVSEILASAPRVKLIATSRESLHLSAEVVLHIDGLALPDRDSTAATADSVRLFFQAASRSDPQFDPSSAELSAVARICRMVEGVPLAIELAAAWVDTLPPVEIADEIERSHDFLSGPFTDLPDRHRSLRAVFDSTWRLLGDEERRSLRRISVFRGGFRRDAAESVAGADLQLLSALVDKSLVRRDGAARFRIPGILRQYAEASLREDEREWEWVARAHDDHFSSLMAEAGQRFREREDEELVRRIGEEIANVREAWRRSVEARRLDHIDGMLDALFVFYNKRGGALEAVELFGPAMDRIARPGAAATATDAHVLARLGARTGVFCSHLGLYARAQDLLESALDSFRSSASTRETAFTLQQLGLISSFQGQYGRAKELLMESHALYSEMGDRRGVGRTLSDLGIVEYALGNYEESKSLFTRSLRTLREIGDRSGVSACLKNLGGVAYAARAYAEADALLQESLEIDRATNNQLGIANALQNLGAIAYRAGDHRKAEAYLREGVALSADRGFRRAQAYCLNELGNVQRAQGRLPEAELLYRQALTIAADLDQVPMMLETLLGFAQLATDRGAPGDALDLLTVVCEHPAASDDTRARARELLRSSAGRDGAAPAHPEGDPPGPPDLRAAVRRVLGDGARATPAEPPEIARPADHR